MSNKKICSKQAKEKAARYAQSAPRTLMPRPTVYGSKKAYSRQRAKRDLASQLPS